MGRIGCQDMVLYRKWSTNVESAVFCKVLGVKQRREVGRIWAGFSTWEVPRARVLGLCSSSSCLFKVSGGMCMVWSCMVAGVQDGILSRLGVCACASTYSLEIYYHHHHHIADDRGCRCQ